ncbi:MAG: amidase family protein, partial [Pseudomonadota bacterium]
QLNAAGMIMLGKTNMDEFAMGSSNESSYFGAVQNPHAIEYVPGGSSGGSAAAVAAGLAPIATGTDTGGSIRQPASFCGITGLKPTYGRVSRYGMIAFASSLDQGGPMARSAADAALLLTAMAGFDPRDSTSAGPENKLVEASNAWLDRVREQGLDAPDEPLTIGLPQQYYRALSNADCAAALQEMHRTLEAAGHRLVDIELPHTDVAIPTYYVIAGAEASTNLSRYDGVRFGHRCADPQDLTDLYERSRGEGFGAEVKRRILTGTYALSVGYYDAYYVKAQKIRRLIANDFHAAFKEVDVILAPTTPGPAFKQGELNRDPVAMYNQDKFTVPVSLAGLPALSLPCGSSQVGDAATLPLGAQLIAPAFGEERILRLAHQYQTATDWHSRWAPQNGASA